MCLVFDTNVYVSVFVIPGSKSDLAFRLASRGVFELVVSPDIVVETRGKLAGPKFGFTEAQLDRAQRAILEDEPDNRILECAVAAGAAAIVTGDKDLLALKNHESIGIMTVAELLYAFPEL